MIVIHSLPQVIMAHLVLILSLTTAVSAAGFVVIAVLWLKKLREAVSTAIGETAHQQIRAAQNLGDSISKMQKQLRLHDQQFQTLALSHSRIKHDLESIAGRMDPEAAEVDDPAPCRVSARTVH
jgi:hypothetical protein